jgi:hypothetical protein
MIDGWIFKKGPRRNCFNCSDMTAGFAEKASKTVPLCPRCRDTKGMEIKLNTEIKYKTKIKEGLPEEIVLLERDDVAPSEWRVQDGVSSLSLNGGMVNVTIQESKGAYFVYMNGALIKANTPDGKIPSYDQALDLAWDYLQRKLERTIKDMIRWRNGHNSKA